ncbi:MAG: amidase [Microscillaceae bacterium]|jgi:amidase|nr:amidase [Microscillaceae bacterium]
MNFSEYVSHDALGLAELVKQETVKPLELLELAIQRAEAVNPTINAIIYKMYDEGKKMIAHIPQNAPFAGVPFLIKDLGIHVAGLPLRTGCRGYQNFVSKQDSEITKKYRQAGFIFMGKTNTPEFGLNPFTEPELFGATRNPWNLNHSSGGSSGGSAAAVAAGIVPIATASDGGGSIRIPASCCGLFGLKVSRGRTPMGDLYGEMWSSAVVENCVTRSVRDSAAFLDAIQGETAGAPYFIQAPAKPYSEEIKTDPGKLKIVYSLKHTLGHTVDEACISAVKHTAELLKNLGHQVEEVGLPYQKEMLTEVFLTMILGETAADVAELSAFLGRKARPSDMEANTYALYLLGRAYSAQEFASAKRRWNELGRQMGHFHQKYDILLTPTLATPPYKIGELKNSPTEEAVIKLINRLGLGKLMKNSGAIPKLAEKIYAKMPYTPIANMTGQPAMSVPLYWSSAGLPIGSMFTAQVGGEDVLFRLAAQLEKAQPWFDKLPKLE